MITFYVDFNNQDDEGSIILPLDAKYNSTIDERNLTIGAKVLLYDEGDKYEAILLRGLRNKWVAKIVPGTNRTPSEEEWKSRISEGVIKK